MKKVYVFYITKKGLESCNRFELDDIFLSSFPDCIIEEMRDDSNYVIPYAYTFNKKFAKVFRDTRNMKYFREKTIHLQDDEVPEFKNVYDEIELKIGKLQSRWYESPDSCIHSHEYPLLMTYFEEYKMTYEVDTFIWFIFMDIMYQLRIDIPDTDAPFPTDTLFAKMMNPYLLKKKYSQLLAETRYYDILEFLIDPDEWGYDIAMNVDKLQLYNHIYGPLFRKDGIIRLCAYGDSI